MFTMGIVGLGAWGKKIVSSVQGTSDVVTFKSAATRTPANAQEFADEKGVALGSDIGAVINDPDIDGVVICSPAHDHVSQATAALNAGKHVQVIKPLSVTKADAESLFEIADRNGVTLAVSYERCFLPAADEFRKRVKSGALGQIVHVEGAYCAARYLSMKNGFWKTDRAIAPPGALADHILYMMIELIGPVTELEAHGRKQVMDFSVSDTSTVRLVLDGGVSGLLTAIGVTPAFTRLHFFGTEGSLEFRGARQIEFTPAKGPTEIIELPETDPLTEQTESFARSIRNGETYPISRENAIAGVAAVEAMARSTEAGGVVSL